MTVAETLALKVGQLRLSDQLKVLGFVESLRNREACPEPRRDPEGLLADQPSDLSLDDFVTTRREAWTRFPREMPR